MSEVRLIDANALKNAHIECPDNVSFFDFGEMVERFLQTIDKQPTVDAVPVRCKDCKWFQSGIDINGKPFTRCNRLVRTYGHTAPDWFCADGERKDGAE